MEVSVGNKLTTIIVFILICTFSGIAFAAPIPGAGSLLREQQQPQQQLPDRLPKPDEQAVERPPLDDSGIKVVVQGFRFSGISNMATDSELQAVLQDAVGSEHTLADLQKLAARLTDYLQKKGFFLARAYIPNQEITDGILEIAILGGRSDGDAVIRPQNQLRLRQGVLSDMVSGGVRPGEPLHYDKLERSILLVNDLPGISAKSILERGSVHDTTRVLIDVAEGPLLSGGISTDNFGNRYTGTWRGNGYLSVNDPFGIGDQLQLSMTGSENLYHGRAAYSAQLHPSGLRGGISFSSLYYKLGRELKNLDADGHAETIGASLSYPLIRSRSFSLWGNAVYEYRMLNDYMADKLLRNSNLHSGTLDLTANSFDNFGGGGFTNIRLAITIGSLEIGNNTSAQLDALAGRTAGGYGKLSYSLARLQRLADQLTLFGSVSGQLAINRNLDSSEKIILGGPTGVRSYPLGEASGDEGHILTTELRYDTPLPPDFGDLQLIGFMDAGMIRLNHKLWPNAVTNAGNKNSYWLYGGGVGLNYSYSDHLSLRLSYAHTLGSNSGRSVNDKYADGRHDDNRFWMQASVWF